MRLRIVMQLFAAVIILLCLLGLLSNSRSEKEVFTDQNKKIQPSSEPPTIEDEARAQTTFDYFIEPKLLESQTDTAFSSNPPPPSVEIEVFETFGEVGKVVGDLRRKALFGEPLSREIQDWLGAEGEKISGLDAAPQEFSDFQAHFIGGLLNLDSERISQVSNLVLGAMTRVANEHITLAEIFALPVSQQPELLERRQSINRESIKEIHSLLTAGERDLFDRAIMSVVDADFGVDHRFAPSKIYNSPVLGINARPN